jgi:hypothetical protein
MSKLNIPSAASLKQIADKNKHKVRGWWEHDLINLLNHRAEQGYTGLYFYDVEVVIKYFVKHLMPDFVKAGYVISDIQKNRLHICWSGDHQKLDSPLKTDTQSP